LTQDTSTLELARAHARAQAGAPSDEGPLVPPGDGLLWQERIGAGNYAGHLLPRDAVLRLDDTDGDACVQLVAIAAGRPAERLNVADTVKVQWQAYLGEGALLLSDMGRVLLTIVEDTSGRHDALCGAGRGGPVWSEVPNARDLLCLAALKHGLERRHVPPWVNLFKSVKVAADGGLTLDGAPRAGTSVSLRAEVDLVVLLSNTVHPLDDRRDATCTTVLASAALPPRPLDDPFRSSTPERARAFLNTDELTR
jgi:urea carboxylase-associated protein 2